MGGNFLSFLWRIQNKVVPKAAYDPKIVPKASHALMMHVRCTLWKIDQ